MIAKHHWRVYSAREFIFIRIAHFINKIIFMITKIWLQVASDNKGLILYGDYLIIAYVS